MTPGERLRARREALGILQRDVELASSVIAEKKRNLEYLVTDSKLSDVETKNRIPSIFCIHALALIYRLSFREICSWYEIDIDTAEDLGLPRPPHTHLVDVDNVTGEVEIPVRLDRVFDPRKTTNIGRLIQEWGRVPVSFIFNIVKSDYTYGYIGTDDFTMYPILLPGSFVQVDEDQTEVINNKWQSEYERPIYLVLLRDGRYVCCWCHLEGDRLTLLPHPRSPVAVTIMRHPQEAEVIGRVVGMAMRLEEVSWAKPQANHRLHVIRT